MDQNEKKDQSGENTPKIGNHAINWTEEQVEKAVSNDIRAAIALLQSVQSDAEVIRMISERVYNELQRMKLANEKAAEQQAKQTKMF